MLARLDHAPAGFEQLDALVRNNHLWLIAFEHMRFKRVGEVMHIHHRARNAAFGQAIKRVVDRGFPATRTIGFGMAAVSGRIRLPSPAAITIAVSDTRSLT